VACLGRGSWQATSKAGHLELSVALSERSSVAFPKQVLPLPWGEPPLSTLRSPGRNEDCHWQSITAAAALDQFKIVKHTKSIFNDLFLKKF